MGNRVFDTRTALLKSGKQEFLEHGFKNRLIQKFEDSYQAFFEAYATVPVEREVTKTVVQMKFAQYCGMLFGSYTKEEAVAITERLQTFTRAGLGALLHTTFESPV